MNVVDAIKDRYSCRDYSDKPISRELILELLALANQAPSSGNQQNRHFIVIQDKETRQYLGDMNNQQHLAEAPVVILVCTKLSKETIEEYLESLKKWEMTVNGTQPEDFIPDTRFKEEFREMKYKWMISDVAAAVENLLLAATAKGLGTCWVGIMDFADVIEKFNLPDGMIPVCLISLGYPKAPPKYRNDRKNIEDLVSWEEY